MAFYKEIAITICELHDRGIDSKQIALEVGVTEKEVMTVITELYPIMKES